MTASFAVTWDYRCPFARNAHEHLLTALEAGADWDVTFLAFALDQAHIAESDAPVWDRTEQFPGLLANAAGIVVRDRMPDDFLRVHRALFGARHDEALDLRDRDVLIGALDRADVNGKEILAEIDDGWPLEVHRKEHTDAADRLRVFGVPTFIQGDRAVFVRLLDRPGSDADRATSSIDRVIDLVGGWPELNEFKYTSIPR